PEILIVPNGGMSIVYNCVNWVGDVTLEARAIYHIPGEMDQPGDDHETSKFLSCGSIGPNATDIYFDPTTTNTNLWSDDHGPAAPDNYCQLIFKPTANGSALGKCGSPRVEERIWRSNQYPNGSSSWSPWFNTSDDLFWDTNIPGVRDNK